MKWHFLLIAFLFSLESISQQANDSASIVQLLKADYATMDNMDIKAHVNNLTQDYYLIEKGEVWDINTELDSIYRKNINKTFKRTDFFTIKLVKVSGDMAYAIWHLKSEYNDQGRVTERAWNESGVFRREDNRWKIALIHSSRDPGKVE
jgi:ketosteroid isomerase-like protein